MELEVYNVAKEVVGKKSLDESVFSVEVNKGLIHAVVTSHLARLRRGTASAKTRAEVVGSGKKPWKQKGTGNARAGTKKSPLWRGGGITFGPKPRQYSLKVNRKGRQIALRSALTLKAGASEIFLMDKFDFKEPGTKELTSMLEQFGIGNRVLILVDQANQNLSRSASNLKNVRIQQTDAINVYDILACRTLFLTEGAVSKIEDNLKNA